MRKVYYSPEYPPGPDAVAAAQAAGAGEILVGEGGYVEIEEPGDTLEGRLSTLADRRWKASLITTWRGYTVPCDAEAATNVLGAIVGLQLASSQGPITWKIEGAFQSLSLTDLIDLGQTMRAHVQACFGNEQTIAAQIAAAQDVTARLAVDLEAGWPA